MVGIKSTFKNELPQNKKINERVKNIVEDGDRVRYHTVRRRDDLERQKRINYRLEYERILGEMSKFTPHGGHIPLQTRTHKERLHHLKKIHAQSVQGIPHPITATGNGSGSGSSNRS